METATLTILQTAFLKTPLGVVEITGNDEGLTTIKFSEAGSINEIIPLPLEKAALQIEEYFQRKRTTFDLNLNPQGSEFQKKVWTQLLKLPFGKTISYKELAVHLGDETLTRAVGHANSKNPIGIVVPCHRVIGNDGSLTGYAGGIHRKEWLLQFEQNAVQGNLF